jgi:hypothetical protein
LIDGKYQLMPSVSLLREAGKMVWIPEIALGIGCEQGDHGDWQREWVYWYDRFGKRYPTAHERATMAEAIAIQSDLAKQRTEAIAIQEKQKNEKLMSYLKSIGINPEDL